jgi:predicted transcriptional regulator
MSKATKKQESPTEALRSTILSSSIPLTKYADRSGIPYYRVRRIVMGEQLPTLDEGEKLRTTLYDFLANISFESSSRTAGKETSE